MIVRRLTVAPEPPSEQFGPGVIGDFTKIGEATMAVAGGMLTTADVTQVDGIQGGLLPEGTNGLLLSLQTVNGAPIYLPVTNWPAGGSSVHYPTLYQVNNTSDVAGYVGTGGVDNQGHTGVTGNYPGDMLIVRNSGPFISDTSSYYSYGSPVWSSPTPGPTNVAQDTYYWDGSNWVFNWHWVGPTPVTSAWFAAHGGETANWEAIPVARPAPSHPNIYAYQWTKPGQFADGVRFRARLKLAPAATNVFGVPFSSRVLVGVCMNMVDLDHGLTWCPWGGPWNTSGWTKKPSDLKGWGAHYLPERVQSGGAYCLEGQQPLGGTLYADAASGYTETGIEDADLHGGGWEMTTDNYLLHPGSSGDVWIEVWRESNTAHAALYQNDPEAVGSSPVATSTFAEDLTGGPYADGQDGYFGIIFSWLNSHAGLVMCEVVP